MAVVYSPRTTNTHLVSAQASEMLSMASAAPVTPAQLAELFSPDTESDAQLTDLLEGLMAAGLLRQAP